MPVALSALAYPSRFQRWHTRPAFSAGMPVAPSALACLSRFQRWHTRPAFSAGIPAALSEQATDRMVCDSGALKGQ